MMFLTVKNKYFKHSQRCNAVLLKWFTGKWGRVFDRDFTKSLIIRDFDDVLKNPFRYVDLFLLHTLLSKEISKNRHARPVTEGSKLRYNTPPFH